MILAVDTSLALLSVALIDELGTAGFCVSRSEGSRNEKLLPALDWLLGEAGVKLDAIHLLAVTRGPGSFTGIRIGLATVQGMAVALGRPVCALSTHEALAAMTPVDSVLVTSDAGRDELYVSGYRSGEMTLPTTIASREQTHAWSQDFSRTVSAEEMMQTMPIALFAARRASEIEREGVLDRYADPIPLYVRLAEADARRLGRAHE